MIALLTTRVVIVGFCGIPLLVWASGGRADEYREQIAKTFVGFEILTRSDFTSEVQAIVKTDPGLVKGHFNSDNFEDFAAIILDRSKQHGQPGERKYYFGKYVVCHGAGKARYQCQGLKEERIYLPYEAFLFPVSPGRKIRCIANQENLSTAEITLKRDAFGWAVPDRGSRIYIYQPDGTYSECGQPFD